MRENQTAIEPAADPKPIFDLSGLFGRKSKDEVNPVIEARFEGLSRTLEKSLPPKGCFRH